MGGDSSWQDTYADPFRCRFDGSTQEVRNWAPPRVEEVHSEVCTVKVVMMHRPTHEPEREKTGEYPFSWHLAQKKRLWEVRLQIKFHQPPQGGKLFFGIELDRYVAVSGVTKQAQKALVSACKGVVGDCYHTVGDADGIQGEKEAPAFVMPLWAFDQFHEADVGREPELTGDLSGVGFLRSEGVSKYINALKSVMRSFSTDKVYTFCFWGISRFLDIMRWQVIGGLVPGVKLDFNQFCGSPPVYMTMYELTGVAEQDKDQRHLPSRKTQYFRAAFWSESAPKVAEPLPPQVSDYWAAQYGYVDNSPTYEHPKPEEPKMDDLLGLDDAAQKTEQTILPPATQQPPQAENTDLLGLF